MELNIAKQRTALKNMSINQLRDMFAHLYGDATTVHHRDWLTKKILWRMQANSEGDISERARRRALEVANDSDLRGTPPKPRIKSFTQVLANHASVTTDDRLPMPGSIISKVYKGQTLEVLVLTDGFEYQGEEYKSLSAVAKEITGSHCNGFLFFGLKKPRAK